MKTLSKRKKIILIVVILILISLLTVTEVTGIYYYRSHIKAKTNWSWSGGIALTEELEDTLSIRLNKCGQPVSIKNISVEASYEANKYTITADTCDTEFAELSTFNTGAIWTPLYKNASFHATANVELHLVYQRIKNKRIVRTYDTQKGNITIHGHVSIIGMCGYIEARKTILAHALKELARAVRDRIQEVNLEYESSAASNH